jgi:hypothetical protein
MLPASSLRPYRSSARLQTEYRSGEHPIVFNVVARGDLPDWMNFVMAKGTAKTGGTRTPAGPNVEGMVYIVEGLERGDRTQAKIHFQREILLFAVGIILLMFFVLVAVLAHDPSTMAIPKALAGVCAVSLTGSGGVLYVMRGRALRSAERWKGIAAAYRVTGISQAQVNKLDDVVFPHLKRETQHGAWPGNLAGLFKSRAA